MNKQSRTQTRLAMPFLLIAATLIVAAPASAQISAPPVKASPVRASTPLNGHNRRPTLSTSRPTVSRGAVGTFQGENRASQAESEQQRRPSLASLPSLSRVAPTPVKPETTMKVMPPVQSRIHQ